MTRRLLSTALCPRALAWKSVTARPGRERVKTRRGRRQGAPGVVLAPFASFSAAVYCSFVETSSTRDVAAPRASSAARQAIRRDAVSIEKYFK